MFYFDIGLGGCSSAGLTSTGQSLSGVDLRLQQELIAKYEELLRFKEAEQAAKLRELEASAFVAGVTVGVGVGVDFGIDIGIDIVHW